MAPTICSEKKPRQIRTNLKEIRRQQNSTSVLLSSASTVGSSSIAGVTTASSANGNAPSNASSIMDYVSATRNMRSRIKPEISNAIEQSSLQSMRANRLHLELNQQQEQQQQQVSDNIVSSSSTGMELLRANEMDIDNDITDEEDCEVHSITSRVHCNNSRNNHNQNNNNNTTSYNSNTNNHHSRHFIDCCSDDDDDKTVLLATPAASSAFSENQIATTNNNNNNNNNNNMLNNRRHYACDEDETNSDSYTSMCDMKNTEGLLAIALKTIKLVKRNQMLQRRLTELQLETSEFIESVLANPENRHFRDKMQSPMSPQTISSAASSPLSTMSSSSQSPQSPTTTTTSALAIMQQQSPSAAEGLTI